MNIKEYISSGILESYVLGSCTVDEQREVEVYALQYKEVQEELNAIREALGDFTLLEEKTPPPHLKEKIAAAIKQSGSSSSPVPESKKEAKIIKLEPAKDSPSQTGSAFYKFAAAASVALLIGSAYMNYHFSTKLDDNKKEIALLNADLLRIAKDQTTTDSVYAIEKKKMEIKLAQLDMVKKPSMVAMPMTGKENAPDAKVCVYGDSKTNEIYLEVNKLPKAPTGMQYQLWAIVKGKPVSAGMIQMCDEPDTCGILKMNTIADAHAFAISLEKEGGVTAPQGNIYATFGL